jgi:hypothetical protein
LHSETDAARAAIIQLHEEIQMRKEIVLAVALALGSTFAVAQEKECIGADGKPVSADVVKKFDADNDKKLSATECAEAKKGGAEGPKREGGPAGAPPADKPPADKPPK